MTKVKEDMHAYEERLSPNKIRLCILWYCQRRCNDEHIVNNKSSLQLALTRLYSIFSASFVWLSLPSVHPWLLTSVTLRLCNHRYSSRYSDTLNPLYGRISATVCLTYIFALKKNISLRNISEICMSIENFWQ